MRRPRFRVLISSSNAPSDSSSNWQVLPAPPIQALHHDRHPCGNLALFCPLPLVSRIRIPRNPLLSSISLVCSASSVSSHPSVVGSFSLRPLDPSCSSFVFRYLYSPSRPYFAPLLVPSPRSLRFVFYCTCILCLSLSRKVYPEYNFDQTIASGFVCV